MKKFILVVAAVLGIAVVAAAQPRALGIRGGFGAELSYQHTLGGENFGELDLGWNSYAFQAAVAYDFMIAPLGPLNFYAGPQVTAALIRLEDNSNAFALGAGAQIGLEYLFPSIPLQLSLDWKPTFIFIPGTAFGLTNVALGIRYLF